MQNNEENIYSFIDRTMKEIEEVDITLELINNILTLALEVKIPSEKDELIMGAQGFIKEIHKQFIK